MYLFLVLINYSSGHKLIHFLLLIVMHVAFYVLQSEHKKKVS